jgi:transposase
MNMHACQMGRPGRKAVPVVLTGATRRALEAMVDDPTLPERGRLRARIVLGAAAGASNRQLAAELGCSEPTVSQWRKRFAEHGVAGLSDAGDRTSSARRGRPARSVAIDETDRQVLERWVRRHKASQALALRARIVLAAAEGGSNIDIAAKLGCNPATVGKWRRRYAEQGIDGLLDEPRVGRPREIGDEVIEAIIVDTLQRKPPDEATHWSTRSMAKHAQVSQTMVSRVWRAFGLKPHQQDTWKLSGDPQFVDKVRDIVGLYLDPPERAVVLCVDE